MPNKKKTKTFREWRKSLGLTINDVSQVTGVNFGTLTKFDYDPDRRPRDFTARAIRKKYPRCPLVA